MKLIRFSLPISISISNDRFPISLELYFSSTVESDLRLPVTFFAKLIFCLEVAEDPQVIINRLQLEF